MTKKSPDGEEESPSDKEKEVISQPARVVLIQNEGSFFKYLHGHNSPRVMQVSHASRSFTGNRTKQRNNKGWKKTALTNFLACVAQRGAPQMPAAPVMLSWRWVIFYFFPDILAAVGSQNLALVDTESRKRLR